MNANLQTFKRITQKHKRKSDQIKEKILFYEILLKKII